MQKGVAEEMGQLIALTGAHAPAGVTAGDCAAYRSLEFSSHRTRRCGAVRLCDFQVGGRLLAGAPVSLKLVGDLHALRQATQA